MTTAKVLTAGYKYYANQHIPKKQLSGTCDGLVFTIFPFPAFATQGNKAILA